MEELGATGVTIDSFSEWTNLVDYDADTAEKQELIRDFSVFGAEAFISFPDGRLLVKILEEAGAELSYHEGYLGSPCKVDTESGFFASEAFVARLLARFDEHVKPPPTAEELLLQKTKLMGDDYRARNVNLTAALKTRDEEFATYAKDAMLFKAAQEKEVSNLKAQIAGYRREVEDMKATFDAERKAFEARACSMEKEMLHMKTSFGNDLAASKDTIDSLRGEILKLETDNRVLAEELKKARQFLVDAGVKMKDQKDEADVLFKVKTKLAEVWARKEELEALLTERDKAYRLAMQKAKEESDNLRLLLKDYLPKDPGESAVKGFFDDDADDPGGKSTEEEKGGRDIQGSLPDNVNARGETVDDYIANLMGK